MYALALSDSSGLWQTLIQSPAALPSLNTTSDMEVQEEMTLQDIKYYQQITTSVAKITVNEKKADDKIISSLLLDTPTLVYDQVGHVLANEYLIEVPRLEFFNALKYICCSSLTSTNLNTNDVNMGNTKKLLNQMLEDSISFERKHAQGVDICRQKDSERGNDIIPDYKHVNAAYTVSSSNTAGNTDLSCSNDKVVQSAYVKAGVIQELVDSLKQKYQLS